ncbi:MAG: glycine cleavage system protein GcvH [Desulfovibrionales bacterium]
MIPEELKYTKSHEWIMVEGSQATMGITQFAQEQLGDITFIDLPEIGQQVTVGDEIGSVESVKAASEIYAPMNGEIVEVNENLEDEPEKINEDPYGAGWIAKIKFTELPSEMSTPLWWMGPDISTSRSMLTTPSLPT